jgi:hypothetical protein
MQMARNSINMSTAVANVVDKLTAFPASSYSKFVSADGPVIQKLISTDI